MKKKFRNTGSGLALALVLEIIALAITIGADKSKRIFTLNTFSQLVSGVYNLSFQVQNYFYLRKENQKLLQANHRLLQERFNCQQPQDTIYGLIDAKVVKNSVNRANNMLIISAGAKQGVEPGDGVISATGNLVGSVISVSDNYASVLSVLNKISSVSVLHKKTNTLGNLVWSDITSPRFARLTDIPIYLPVEKGDTIITSGYSQIFPRGVLVGTVYSVRKTKTSNSYDIKVLLAEDLSRLQYVFVVKNNSRKEIENLAKKSNKILGLNE